MSNFIITDRPIYPIVLMDNTSGYLDLIDNDESLTNSNALGLINGVHKNYQAYDKRGQLWKVGKIDSNFKVNILTKFLAYTIYNPKIKITISWIKITDYKLDDLKNDINKQVDRYDDIITQFEEGEIIKRQIENCDSFDSIINTLNKYVFKVNEEELWKEHEMKNKTAHHCTCNNYIYYFNETTSMRYIFILTLIFCASCGQSTDPKVSTNKNAVQSTKVEQEKLIENALNFINSYTRHCNKMKEAIGVAEWSKSNKLTTQSFKTSLEKIIDEAYKLDPEIGLEADPIFDAQDYPSKGFELDSFNEGTNYVVVKGKDWPDFKLTIKMVKDNNNNWLVDGCGIINIPSAKRMAR